MTGEKEDDLSEQEQLKRDIKFYDDCLKFLQLVKINHPDGSTSERLMKSSELLKITKSTGAFNDEGAKAMLRDQRELILNNSLIPRTKAILESEFMNKQIKEPEYVELIKEIEQKHDEQSKILWVRKIGLKLGVLTVAKQLRFAVIKDESGIIHGMQMLTDKAKEDKKEKRDDGKKEQDTNEL
jgi:hypothetical protein